jgi:hypothetical protein
LDDPLEMAGALDGAEALEGPLLGPLRQPGLGDLAEVQPTTSTAEHPQIPDVLGHLGLGPGGRQGQAVPREKYEQPSLVVDVVDCKVEDAVCSLGVEEVDHHLYDRGRRPTLIEGPALDPVEHLEAGAFAKAA